MWRDFDGNSSEAGLCLAKESPLPAAGMCIFSACMFVRVRCINRGCDCNVRCVCLRTDLSKFISLGLPSPELTGWCLPLIVVVVVAFARAWSKPRFVGSLTYHCLQLKDTNCRVLPHTKYLEDGGTISDDAVNRLSSTLGTLSIGSTGTLHFISENRSRSLHIDFHSRPCPPLLAESRHRT